MSKNDEFGYREDNIMKGMPEAVKSVKGSLFDLLSEKLKADNGLNAELKKIQEESASASEKEQSNQRVRKIENPFSSSTPSPEIKPAVTEQRPINYTSEDNVWRGGYSGPFVLILMGVLILSISLIVYLVMSFR